MIAPWPLTPAGRERGAGRGALVAAHRGTVDRILQLGQSPLAAPQTTYVKYLTKELFQSPTGFDHLPYVEASICAAEPPVLCVSDGFTVTSWSN